MYSFSAAYQHETICASRPTSSLLALNLQGKVMEESGEKPF